MKEKSISDKDGSTKYSTGSRFHKDWGVIFPKSSKKPRSFTNKFILSGNLVHDKKPPMNWSASSSYHSTPGLFNVKFQLCRLDQLSDEHENLFFICPVIYSTFYRSLLNMTSFSQYFNKQHHHVFYFNMFVFKSRIITLVWY